jgi:PAS domain S-box-containing protein
MSPTDPNKIQKDLLLSTFTIENLHEAVFWVDAEQNIFHVNEVACQMIGYSREELTQKKITDINPSSVVMDWENFWKRLKNEK